MPLLRLYRQAPHLTFCTLASKFLLFAKSCLNAAAMNALEGLVSFKFQAALADRAAGNTDNASSGFTKSIVKSG